MAPKALVFWACGKIGQGDGLLLESSFLYYFGNGSFWDVFKALLGMLLLHQSKVYKQKSFCDFNALSHLRLHLCLVCFIF